jgi:hypothetical protein
LTEKVRLMLLAVVTASTAGMGVELLLLGHYKDANQLIPLAVGAFGLVTVTWVAAAPGIVAVRALQFAMLVFIGSGIVGATLHLQAEVDAPALAPGLLVQLGALGLLATHRHPVLNEPER